jgi:hypothetical protein
MKLKEGVYTLEGNKFYIDGKKFAVLERKKEVEKKPKNYLATLSPFQYISSLFPSKQEGKYNFDFQQELFELELLTGEGKAVLKKLEIIE